MHVTNPLRASFAAALLLLALASQSFAADAAKSDAPKPPPFDAEIRAFEAADAKSTPAPGGVLFIGSSSIKGWKNTADDFPGIPVINRGFGGSQIRHSTMYADRIVLPYKPKAIVFYAGDNDIAANRTPAQVLGDFKAFAEKVHATLPDTRIHFISIKPSIKRWKLVDKMKEANRLVKEFADASGGKVGYIDIFTPMLGADGQPRPELLGPDGLHMTRKGYELWRDTVAPVLKDHKR
jgi:lysophospholipase L1-like esterase